jgi:hypothetical protein
MKRLTDRFIPDWKGVLKRAHSVKLYVLAPILWEILSAAPPELRSMIGLPAFIILAGAAIFARLWKQKPARKRCDG